MLHSAKAAESAPAVAVVPINVSVGDTDFAPPVGEFVARDIEGRGCDQVIENDGVLLAPAKTGDSFQIIVIEQMPRDRLAARGTVQWTIHRFGGRKHEGRRNLRKVQKQTRIDA